MDSTTTQSGLFAPGRDRLIALLLWVTLSTVIFASVPGVSSSNDGSHYALLRAVAETGRFEIGPFRDFTQGQDIAYHGDEVFSDRPPGVALLASPFYGVTRALAVESAHRLDSMHDAENPYMPWGMLSSSLLAAGTAALFYLSMRRQFGLSLWPALLAAIILGLGTTLWRYGMVLFSHASAAFFVWLSLTLLFELELRGPDPAISGLFGFVLGFNLLTEYSNTVFIAAVGLYAVAVLGPGAWQMWSTDRRWRASVLSFFVMGAIPLAFLLFYNAANFGSPFSLSSSNVDFERWPENASLAARFSTPLRVGLPATLWTDGVNQGIFLLTPAAWIGLPGLIYGFRRGMIEGFNRRLFLLLGVFAFYEVLFSMLTYYNPYTNDSRYIVTFITGWFVFVAFGLEWLLRDQPRQGWHWAALLTAFALMWLSIRNQMWHVLTSWGRTFAYTDLAALAFHPVNMRAITSALLVNLPNVPVLWAWLLVSTLGLWGISILFTKRGEAA